MNLRIYCLILSFIIANSAFCFAGKRKVLLIGLDGVRSDVLQNMQTPAFEFLSKHGFGTYTSWHQDITISGPSWSSILCGVYHNKHGVTDNSFRGKNYEKYPMLPLIAKRINPHLKFGMYMEWQKFIKNSVNNGWDTILSGELGNTNKTTEEVEEWIQQSDLDFYFVYLGEPDYWGHRFGFSDSNPLYVNAIRNIDYSIVRLMQSLQKRLNYQSEDWLILITTDHGGHGLTHGNLSVSERQIFWFAYSERIQPRIMEEPDINNLKDSRRQRTIKNICPVQTDIAVTALHHLLYPLGRMDELQHVSHLEGKSWLEIMGLASDKRQIDNLASSDYYKDRQ